jgi:hypothetical protein
MSKHSAYGGDGKAAGKTPFLGDTKTSNPTKTAFHSQDTLSEAKQQAPPKARLKPTFNGKVPHAPGNINKGQP